MSKKFIKTARKIVRYIKETYVNKLMAMLLLIIGCLPLWIDNDATLLILMSIFALPLFFARHSCLYKV